MNGFLNVDKPSGMTSRDVVNRVSRAIGIKKIGHAGTLDPLASGVLVLGIGSATRLIEYIQRMPKTYRGTFLLGRTSPTEDIEGEVMLLDNPPVPTLEELQAAARVLVGETLQRPPAYSALKVAGRRAYDLARKGEAVVLEPRPITVFRLSILSYNYPELMLEIECSGGTYVRSLGRDLAEAVGTAAVMSALMRTAIGSFQQCDACRLDDLSASTLQRCLQPLQVAVMQLPRLDLTTDEAESVRFGRFITRGESFPPKTEFAAFDESDMLVAVLVARSDGRLQPTKNLV